MKISEYPTALFSDTTQLLGNASGLTSKFAIQSTVASLLNATTQSEAQAAIGIDLTNLPLLTIAGGVDPDSNGVNNATTIGNGIFITKREQYTGGPQLRTIIDGGFISCQDTIQVKGPESYDSELFIHGYGMDFVGSGSIGVSGNYGGLYIASPTGIDLVDTTTVEGTAPTAVDTGTIVLGGGEGWFAGKIKTTSTADGAITTAGKITAKAPVPASFADLAAVRAYLASILT